MRKKIFSLPCSWHYFKITDEKNTKVGQYCGEQTGKRVVVGGDYSVITFHSDDWDARNGFRFRVYFTSAQPSKFQLNVEGGGSSCAKCER